MSVMWWILLSDDEDDDDLKNWNHHHIIYIYIYIYNGCVVKGYVVLYLSADNKIDARFWVGFAITIIISLTIMVIWSLTILMGTYNAII